MTNTNKEMTKVEALEMAIKELTGNKKNEALVDKLEKMKNQEEKLASKKRKPSKTSLEVEKDMTLIIDTLNQLGDKETAYTGLEIAELVGSHFEDYTPQKLTSRLTRLVKDGKLEKVAKATNDKKKVGYKLA